MHYATVIMLIARSKCKGGQRKGRGPRLALVWVLRMVNPALTAMIDVVLVSFVLTLDVCIQRNILANLFVLRFAVRLQMPTRGYGVVAFLSVRLSNACFVIKRKKLLPTFIPLKDDYPSFSTRRMVGRGRPLVPEILGQIDPSSL